MSDYGFNISPENVDARKAAAKDLLLTSKWPLLKLDRTKSDSFRNVRITFNNNTPDGVKTEVYKYAHGKNYKPHIWSSGQTFSAAAANTYQKYFQENGRIAAINVFQSAFISVEADETNIYVYVNRTTVSIIGVAVMLRIYNFVDDSNL